MPTTTRVRFRVTGLTIYPSVERCKTVYSSNASVIVIRIVSRVPPVGMKVLVRVNQYIDGWGNLPVTFSEVVPASA
jgi:hypothetical protein